MSDCKMLQMLDHIADLADVKKELDTFGKVGIYGLDEGQRTVVEACLFEQKSMLILCDSAKRAKTLWEDLTELLPEKEILYFPALEMIPFEVLGQSGELSEQRISVLNKAKGNVVIVTTIEAFGKVLMPPEVLQNARREFTVGQRVNLDELKAFLVQVGYRVVSQVEKKGDMAFRGGILDVFSVNYAHPLRFEFFDDEIDSIRFFSIKDQRSVEKTMQAQICAAKEFFVIDQVKKEGLLRLKAAYSEQRERLMKKKDREALEKLQFRIGEVLDRVENGTDSGHAEQFGSYFYPLGATLLEYMDKDTLVCFDEANRIEDMWDYLEKERMESLSELLRKGLALPGQKEFYLDKVRLAEAFQGYKRISCSLLPKDSLFLDHARMFSVECKGIPPFFGNTKLLFDELNNWKRQKYRVAILLTSEAKAARLGQMLAENEIESAWQGENYQLAPGQIAMVYGNLSSGAQFLKSKIAIVTENEIFKQQKKQVKKKMFAEDGERINSLDELHIGDYVVHANHGIGHYLGIENLKVGDVERDYLIIKYSGEDRLYVPIDQFNLLQKYTADEGRTPKVNKLGGSDWLKTKAKVKAAVEDIAEQLLQTYAKRQNDPGFAFSADDEWQREFEAAFPYVETEDQLKAIEDVKRDMMAPRAMDRLICGDVGYGKTEVAIRAAFKCVNDNKQVAVLVPTTVLAQQHYNTFKERFEPYGVKVELLSRFKSAKEQKEIIERLGKNDVDIVIGTHKLLNKTVEFFDLGLLIIDEEQRFGVTHKEKIKALRSQVDVLTMSATPIPRTLNMSLVGLRDMSVIETPPQDRYPIQTYVVEYTPELVSDAIRRELGRGGQVYFVHNRVEDIEKFAVELNLLVPEARILVGHGKMKEHELENIMLSFMNGEGDILLCTTIIETGLDIANANTLIIDNADQMGLSQLYQLRGRVGRSNRVAYAYLTYRKNKSLSQVAEKRLSAIREYTELGSGIKIAMRDLEIRGAGNLLGAEQHGQVSAVGFDLYCKMLEETVREMKGEPIKKQQEIELDLEINAFIPEWYIKDVSTKLSFYQRIERINDEDKIDEIYDEMLDRFGDVPMQVENLLEVCRIKIYCGGIGIRSMKQKAGNIAVNFNENVAFTMEDLRVLAEKFRRKITYSNVSGELVVKITVGSLRGKECVDLVKDVLLSMLGIVQKEESVYNK